MSLSPLLLGFLAFALTSMAMPVAYRAAYRWGLVDHPSARKWHTQPTPRTGGIVVYGSVAFLFFLWIVSASTVWRQGVGILLAGTLLWAIGLADDAGRIHHQIKLWIGMPLAAGILFFSGVHAQVFHHPFLNAWITFFWVVGIVSAFNLLDNMDGLTAGVTAVASVFFTTMAWWHGQYFVAILAAILCGVSLGFLAYNYPPATIFLGDGGALFLGLMMAALGLKVDFPRIPTSHSWVFPVLVLGVPIFDTSLVTFSRLRRGLVPFATPGKDHFSHRLHAWGLSPRQVALVHYIIGGALGNLALLLIFAYGKLSEFVWWGIVAGVVIVAILSFIVLETAPYEHQESRE